jgi:hypothetical protein
LVPEDVRARILLASMLAASKENADESTQQTDHSLACLSLFCAFAASSSRGLLNHLSRAIRLAHLQYL